ncbi:FHA domain-containing protein FhaB/FipA [Cellulomonas composti]|uniref:Phosphopeptide-binding protein n=1 Tax=Cellulomonas composti TaxID=266130 RepID=A0A511JDL4_9CELL|nr:FHA domain-containing protein [Cellulomonas composti]GEL96088.1 phosphopeptide-binding protein [Cellulomonas composti]
MSELTITLLRLGYLALLWILVLSAIGVLRRDLYGTRITRRERRAAASGQPMTAAAPTVGTAPAEPRSPRSTRAAAPTRLVVTDGPLTGTTVPLGQSAVLIGRAPGCSLVVDDDYTSSRHARIFPRGDQWYVEDLGSTNGTFVGEQRLTAPVLLTVGTAVRVGRSIIELQR